MDCGSAERRLRVTSWPSLKQRYIMRSVIVVSICLVFLVVNRLVSGSDGAKLTDGLYDPNLHLFADDLDIERTWDVSRVLGKPEPLPSAVIVPDKPWEKERRIWNVTGSVIYDPGFKKYRMWYAAVSPRAGDLNFPEYNCYAESEDGITWVKPDLNLYEYKGSKQNNIVYSTGGTGLWFYRFGVFRDEEDADPGKRYKGLGAAASPNSPTGYYLVTSSDGLRWSRPPKLVVRGGGDTFGMCWDPARKLFLLVARGYVPDRELSDDNVWRAKRVIGIFESSNDYGSSQKNSMERWKYQGIGIDLDQEDDFGRISQHWTMQPFNYGNQYLGLLQVSLGRGAGTTNRVELMSSRDGRAWRYVARHSDFLSRGAAGHWDGTSELLASATPPVPIEDQLHLYMTGRLDPDWFIGMAKLRRDRFVGMMAGDGLPELGAPIPGESSNPRFENSWNGRRMPYIVTNKITVTKPILQVNLEVQTGGVLRVSIHKPYNKREEKPGGEVIAGFGLEDCVPLEGNATRIEVSWRRKKDLRELVGQDIVLMFQLKKATVWSYRFAE